MRRLGHPDMPLPAGSRVLATAERTLDGLRWTTRVWLQDDGRFGATIVEEGGDRSTLRTRREDVDTLQDLDRLLSEDLGRSGPEGTARLAVLSSASVAFEEAYAQAA